MAVLVEQEFVCTAIPDFEVPILTPCHEEIIFVKVDAIYRGIYSQIEFFDYLVLAIGEYSYGLVLTARIKGFIIRAVL
jgi:hypothetical protein